MISRTSHRGLQSPWAVVVALVAAVGLVAGVGVALLLRREAGQVQASTDCQPPACSHLTTTFPNPSLSLGPTQPGGIQPPSTLGELVADPGQAAATPGASTVGAQPLGSFTEAVPTGAVVVSLQGADTAAGSVQAPLRTLKAAVTRARSGQAIVLRAGAYHESVDIPEGKSLTIQPYPGEKVWLDGARPVSGFRPDGGAWSVPWSLVLDSTPGHTSGQPDGTAPGWQWLNPSHPMAAHPDMVWINGVEQRQVGSRAQVKAGTFFVDTTAHRLVVGTNPTGALVEASDLEYALTVVRAPGTRIQGIGIRRFATPIPKFGAVRLYSPQVSVDNAWFADNATVGLGMYDTGITVTRSTFTGNGLMGIQGHRADNAVMKSLLITKSNDEHFNFAPNSGGMKLTQSRQVLVRDSAVVDNFTVGVWFDQSCLGVTIVRNQINRNAGIGVHFELSAQAVVAGNSIRGSGAEGVKIQNASQVQVWNNTVVSALRAVDIIQDPRRPSNPGNQYDLDSRYPHDPDMTWLSTDISVGNNVMEAGVKADSIFAVEDYEQTMNASQMRITTNGNLYSQPISGRPRWVAVWTGQGTDPFVYTRLKDFVTATGQERSSRAQVGSSALTAGGQLTPAWKTQQASIAQPVPANLPVNPPTRTLGTW